MKYTGQTGKPFKIRFQEHLRDFKYNNNRSNFAQQLIDNKHAIGKMEDIMEVVHVTRKSKMMGTPEDFHIYKETKAGNQINDRLTDRENAIFETVIQEDSYRGRAAPPQPNN
jgi:phosphopentomutase